MSHGWNTFVKVQGDVTEFMRSEQEHPGSLRVPG